VSEAPGDTRPPECPEPPERGEGLGAPRAGLGKRIGMELVTPGQTINAEAGFLRGHGTYVRGGVLIASVAGVVQRVNKLISVTPLKSRFGGQIGDVVVGRVTEVGQKRWHLDVASTQAAILMLSSVNLPGGEQRRRTYEDQLNMRSLYAEGDLISAEIHQFFQDGAMSVHTRSRKYGKLEGGAIVEVPSVGLPPLPVALVRPAACVRVSLLRRRLSGSLSHAAARVCCSSVGANCRAAEADAMAICMMVWQYLVRKMKQHFHALGDIGLHLILARCALKQAAQSRCLLSRVAQ